MKQKERQSAIFGNSFHSYVNSSRMRLSAISKSCYTNRITHTVLVLARIFTVNTQGAQAWSITWVGFHSYRFIHTYTEWLRASIFFEHPPGFYDLLGKQTACTLNLWGSSTCTCCTVNNTYHHGVTQWAQCTRVTESRYQDQQCSVGAFLRDRAHLPNPPSVGTDLCWPQVMWEHIINLSAVDWCV